VDVEETQSLPREGKFRAALRFKLQSNDTALLEHFETAAGNAKYTSPEIQNEIIGCCKDIIIKQLVEEINQAKGFSVLADETTDASKKEQLVICIRYLKGDHMKEVFLIFVTVTDLKGTALADVIISTLISIGIDISYMFGQGYDGASSMSSRFQGVQAHIRAQNPLAIYVHCSSHSFNLAVSDACKLPVITNCMAVVASAYDFFRHPKRNNALAKAIEELKPGATATRLKKLCATRWVERHESVLTFIELLGPVLHALDHVISDWTDRDTIAAASALQRSIHDGGFLIAVFVVADIFAISLPLSRQLQEKDMDLAQAISLADTARGVLQGMRDKADEHFHKIFTRVEAVATGI
jgi:DNA-binding HxlR family transcriptional regulator